MRPPAHRWDTALAADGEGPGGLGRKCRRAVPPREAAPQTRVHHPARRQWNVRQWRITRRHQCAAPPARLRRRGRPRLGCLPVLQRDVGRRGDGRTKEEEDRHRQKKTLVRKSLHETFLSETWAAAGAAAVRDRDARSDLLVSDRCRGSRCHGLLSPLFRPAQPLGGLHVDRSVGVVGPVRDEAPLRLLRKPGRHRLGGEVGRK